MSDAIEKKKVEVGGFSLPVDMRELGKLKGEFEKIPVNDKMEIARAFLHFPVGTARKEVLNWFYLCNPFRAREALRARDPDLNGSRLAEDPRYKLIQKLGYVVVESTYAHNSWQWFKDGRQIACEGINFPSEQDALDAACIDMAEQFKVLSESLELLKVAAHALETPSDFTEEEMQTQVIGDIVAFFSNLESAPRISQSPTVIVEEGMSRTANPYMSHDAEDGFYIENAIKIGDSKGFIGAVSEKALDEASGGTENAITLFMSAFSSRDISEFTDNFCGSEVDANTEMVGLLLEGHLCGLFDKKREAMLNEAVAELMSSSYCNTEWETVDDSMCRRIFASMAEGVGTFAPINS